MPQFTAPASTNVTTPHSTSRAFAPLPPYAKALGRVWSVLLSTGMSALLAFLLVFAGFCLMKEQGFAFSGRVWRDLGYLSKGSTSIIVATPDGTPTEEHFPLPFATLYTYYLYFSTNLLDDGLAELAQNCSSDGVTFDYFALLLYCPQAPTGGWTLLNPQQSLQFFVNDNLSYYHYQLLTDSRRQTPDHTNVVGVGHFGFKIFYGLNKGENQYLGYAGGISEMTYANAGGYDLPDEYRKWNASLEYDDSGSKTIETYPDTYSHPAANANYILGFLQKPETMKEFPDYEWFIGEPLP